MRKVILVIALFAVLGSMGCCTPVGCGVGCRTIEGCHDCDGGFGPRAIPMGPLDGLRQIKRSLVCGSGCGEVYYGEWRSTPPDVADPCCGDRFVGGAVPCRPFCWEPGTLIHGLYGRRIPCDDCGLTDDCGCAGAIDSGEIYEGEMISQHSVLGTNCNCGSSHGVPLTSSSRTSSRGYVQAKPLSGVSPATASVRAKSTSQTVGTLRPSQGPAVPANRSR